MGIAQPGNNLARFQLESAPTGGLDPRGKLESDKHGGRLGHSNWNGQKTEPVSARPNRTGKEMAICCGKPRIRGAARRRCFGVTAASIRAFPDLRVGESLTNRLAARLVNGRERAQEITRTPARNPDSYLPTTSLPGRSPILLHFQRSVRYVLSDDAVRTTTLVADNAGCHSPSGR